MIASAMAPQFVDMSTMSTAIDAEIVDMSTLSTALGAENVGHVHDVHELGEEISRPIGPCSWWTPQSNSIPEYRKHQNIEV